MWFIFSCSVCYCDYQVVELQEELSQLREQKAQLEKELDTQTTETQKQVEKSSWIKSHRKNCEKSDRHIEKLNTVYNGYV